MLEHEHEHDHDHETRELTDDELELVSGGIPPQTMCPCQRHQQGQRNPSV